MNDCTSRYQATDERRRAIAAAARSLIVEKGFEGLRTRDIADRVGINIATLHYHVPSKEALIELVAQSLRDDFIAMSDSHARAGQTPIQRLAREFEEVRETRKSHPELLLVMEELATRARRDEKIARYINPLQIRWRDDFTSIFRDGVDDGSFRDNLDCGAAADLVIGAIITSRMFGRDEDAALMALYDELLRSFLPPSRTPDHDHQVP